MTESRGVRVLLRVASALVLVFLYTPLIILAIYAFNPSRIMAWPPTGFTLVWFVEAANNPSVTQAIVNSLIVASVATVLALVLGTLASLAVQRYRFFGQETVSFLLVIPIALPGVVTGLALRTSFITLGIDFGLFTIIVGHATFCVVIAYNNVIARLRRLPRTPEEASTDLGADAFTTFRRITLPGMGTALVSGALLAFALSFDEIIVTNFLSGPGVQTLPIWIFSNYSRPNQLPLVNVAAVLVLVASIVPVYIASRLTADPAAVPGAKR